MRQQLDKIHALSVSDLLDTAFRIHRSCFFLLTGVMVVFQVPLILVQSIRQWQSVRQDVTRWLVPNDVLIVWPFFGVSPLVQWFPSSTDSIVFIITQSFLLQGLTVGVIIRLIAHINVEQRPSLFSSLRYAIRKMPALMSASFILSSINAVLGALMIYCISTVIIIVDNIMYYPSVGYLFVSIVILGATFALLLIILRLYANFFLVYQTIILEDHSVLTALRRSWQLMDVDFWRSIAIVVPVSIIGFLIMSSLSIITGFMSQTINEPKSDIDLAYIQILASSAAQIGMIFALPLHIIFSTLVYKDLRIRNEGYDIEQVFHAETAN